MNSKNRQSNREYIFAEAKKGLLHLINRDPFLEVVSIWVKFKKSNIEVPVYYPKSLRKLPDEYSLKNILNEALNFTSIEYKKDNSISLLKIVLKTSLNTDKRGEILLIDITEK